MQLIQIVPALPPAINGLGDHAFLLAKELRASHGLQTTFLVGTPGLVGKTEMEGFRVIGIRNRTAGDFVDALTTTTGSADMTVLLHYVGYGYAKRGCPVWLVEGFEKWRPASKNRRLITMFHELYASGPIWRSSFWTAAWQQSLTRRLANLSDRCRTSMKMYARRLGQLSPHHHGKIPATPVFSNVGEIPSPKPCVDRKRQLVVFGNQMSRGALYEKYSTDLSRICSRLQVQEIVDIGPPTGTVPDIPVRLTAMGVLNPNDLSLVLEASLAGILNYPRAFLGKSTIFAAYAAHGVIPLLLGPGSERCEDGLQNGHHYLEPPQLFECDVKALHHVSNGAFAWYSRHNLRMQAESLAACLSG